MKSISILVLAATMAAVLPGCGSTPRASVASGTAMGAATGAVVGSFSGNAGRGALLGAGVGALGGVLADEHRRGSFQ
ncbi:glycine zipper family protein [Thiocystis violacea]|uniref:glycine zipper family protein n=1 Tax=Thiocystis violacea TaxID=13725 RepID=UPI001908EBDD|nr:glycine zipper family protein [Thiocystis violacea]MBK1716972.1 glycine zipper family protein [Thiocystis violacea]